MRDFHLRFFVDRRWPDGFEERALDEYFDLSLIPEHSGAYILGTSDGTKLVCPWGNSPVFYIGQSKNLRKRIKEHLAYTKQVMEEHDGFWWPRYQYGAAYGVSIAWYSTRGTQNPNKLEADLIDSFYNLYGSIPVANGAWPSGLKPKHGKRDD